MLRLLLFPRARLSADEASTGAVVQRLFHSLFRLCCPTMPFEDHVIAYFSKQQNPLEAQIIYIPYVGTHIQILSTTFHSE